jgi:hypothetical protein
MRNDKLRNVGSEKCIYRPLVKLLKVSKSIGKDEAANRITYRIS